jgi:hypothetical protein
MVDRIRLTEQLVTDLSRPRILNQQVLMYISDHYGYPVEQLEQFVAEKVPEMDDTELDLTFSPLYTPVLQDRLTYAPLLAAEHLSKEELLSLEDELAEKSIVGYLDAGDGRQIPMPLQPVTMNRYIGRLFLDRPLPERLWTSLSQQVPQEHHPLLNTLGRDPVWQNSERQDLLDGFLQVFQARNSFHPDKVLFLTDFIRTYRPAQIEDLDRQLENLVKSCEEDLQDVPGRGFHDLQLKEAYVENGGEMSPLSRQKEVTENYLHLIHRAKELQEEFQELLRLRPQLAQANTR